MKVTIETQTMWERVRYYNELSHVYSEVADKLAKLTQELEGDYDDK